MTGRAITCARIVLRPVFAVLRDIAGGSLHLRATSLVYTTLLSFAPLLAISFSVLKGIGVHNQLEPFLADLLEPLGADGADIAARIVGFVNNIQVGVLGAVGVAALLFSVMTMMGQIERALNAIWRVAGQRGFLLRLRDYLAVLLVGPLFLFLSVAITAGLGDNSLLQKFLLFDGLTVAVQKILSFVPYMLFMLAFAALYMFMPNTRVRAVPALVAGFVTGVLWKVMGKLFGLFVAGSASYAAIYSAFAALILFMLWLYAGWLLLLAGASLAFYLQNTAEMRGGAVQDEIRHGARLAIALQALADIARAAYDRKPPLTLDDLSRRQNTPTAVLEKVLDDLLSAGMVTRNDDMPAAYLSLRPSDETRVADVAAALAMDAAGAPMTARLRLSPQVRDTIKSIDAAVAAGGSATIKDICGFKGGTTA